MLERFGGAWITKPFNNWKKAIEKICPHVRSDIHIESCEAEMVAARQGTIVQQLQQVREEEKVKNRVAVKALYSIASTSSPNITYRMQPILINLQIS